VIAVAHNMPSVRFGAQGDITWNLERLKRATKDFFQAASDTRERFVLEEPFRALREDDREKANLALCRRSARRRSSVTIAFGSLTDI
jgi:hypothetical protein